MAARCWLRAVGIRGGSESECSRLSPYEGVASVSRPALLGAPRRFSTRIRHKALVDGTEHQIYLSSLGAQEFTIVRNERGIGLQIGGYWRARRGLMCAKITEFEGQLKHDEDARQRFMDARQRTANLNATEAAAWRTLVATHLLSGVA